MLRFKDNQAVSDQNDALEFSILCSIGEREDQQDCFAYALSDDGGMFVVCDGMGGLNAGADASRAAANILITAYEKEQGLSDDSKKAPGDLLYEATLAADRCISELCGPENEQSHAGSTEVAIIIKDKKLYWNSVGDSRALLFRGNEYVQFTQDQNYLTVLNEQLRTGLITNEEFEREKEERGEALISFLGMGDLQLIDYNELPLNLLEGDRILIMSDGLYKFVEEEGIVSVIRNFSNPGDALQALEMKAERNGKRTDISRDNLTAILIKIK